MKRQVQIKGAAFTQSALNAHTTSVFIRHGFDNCQPQSLTAVFICHIIIHVEKSGKQLRLIQWRNTFAVILYRDVDPARITLRTDQNALSPRAELDRVLDQVVERLLDHHLVC